MNQLPRRGGDKKLFLIINYLRNLSENPSKGGGEAKPIARDVMAFVPVEYYVVKIHGDFVIIFVFARTLSTLLCGPKAFPEEGMCGS